MVTKRVIAWQWAGTSNMDDTVASTMHVMALGCRLGQKTVRLMGPEQ